MINLKHLTYFVAVAEELHFGRAAERLGIAQPPLSRQIKALEEEMGAILFTRGRSGVSLTQAGERLLVRSQAILAMMDDTRREVRRIGEGAEGRLRIGFVGSSTFGILPTIIKSFRAAYPAINLSLLPMNNAQLHRQLVGREIDVAIARPALRDAEFMTRQLVEERLVMAVPDRLDTGSGKTADLRLLGTQNVILYPEYPRPSYADFVLNACAAAGHPIHKPVFTMDLQTALSLVAIGEGICVLPESVGSAQRNGIRWLPILPEIARTALSINHRIDEQGVHVRNFIAIAQRVARRII